MHDRGGPGSDAPLDIDLNFRVENDEHPGAPPARTESRESYAAAIPDEPQPPEEAQFDPDAFTVEAMPGSVDELNHARPGVHGDDFGDLAGHGDQEYAAPAVLHDETYEETGGRAGVEESFGSHEGVPLPLAEDHPVENFDDPPVEHDAQFAEDGFPQEGAGDEHDGQAEEAVDEEALLRGEGADDDDLVEEVATPPRSFLSRFALPLGAVAALIVTSVVGFNYVLPMFSGQTTSPAQRQQAAVRPPVSPSQPVVPPLPRQPGVVPSVSPGPSAIPAFPPATTPAATQPVQTPQPSPPAATPLQSAQAPQGPAPAQQATLPPPRWQQGPSVANQGPGAPAPAAQETGQQTAKETDIDPSLGNRIVTELASLGRRLDGIDKRIDEIDSRTKKPAQAAPEASAAPPLPTPAPEPPVQKAEQTPKPKRTASVERHRTRHVTRRAPASDGDPDVPPSKPRLVAGYSLKGVSEVGGRSIAVVRGRGGRMEEVSVGQSLPGAGEVRSIRQDGRGWVVVTSNGVIVE